MFDISFAELGIVGIVGLLVLGPKEMVKLIKFFKKIIHSIKCFYNDCFEEINKDLSSKDVSIVKIVYDDNGNAQHAYDIDKIKPLCKKSANE